MRRGRSALIPLLRVRIIPKAQTAEGIHIYIFFVFLYFENLSLLRKAIGRTESTRMEGEREREKDRQRESMVGEAGARRAG